MRKYFLGILIAIFISLLCEAQHNNRYTGLSQRDRKNYILSVDQHTIGKLKDIVLYKQNYRFAYILLRLSNNSSDTLKYINMTCSWSDAFIIDNQNIGIKGWSCDSNFPEVYKIPPHKSSTFNIPLLFPRNLNLEEFRIGLYLLRYDKQNDGFSYFDDFLNSKATFKNFLIWSNEIIITKEQSMN